MTILALDSFVSTDLKNDKVFSESRAISPENFSRTGSIQRFSLRKRCYDEGESLEVNIPAVNSAFLSGLFADVAAAQTDSTDGAPESWQLGNLLEQTNSDADLRLDSNASNKKSRINLSKSMSRCPKSFKILTHLGASCNSPNQATTLFFDEPTVTRNDDMGRSESLHYQLHCISDSPSTEKRGTQAFNGTPFCFPFLPNAVSNSSCASSLTRSISDLQTSITETSAEKAVAYGWFVEMDDDELNNRVNFDTFKTSQSNALAFCAPTAPKGSNYDDELEWAKAADTVDDVLGDFF